MKKIRVMLVDDHNVLRAGVRALLERQPDIEVVAETDSVASAHELAHELRPEVLVLDLSLPGGGSLEFIKRVTAFFPEIRTLILTMHDEPAYAKAALAAGATGFVVKTINEQDLVAAVRAVHRGKVLVDLDDNDKTSAVFGSRVTLSGARRRVDTARLSERETEVLRLLGQGYSNQSVADQLELSPKTVGTYRSRIGEKLGLRTTADFVKYATETGLLRTGRDLT